MSALRFESLPFLLAVPFAAALVIAIRSGSRAELGPVRRALSLLTRALAVALLLAAMAGPSWTERFRPPTATVILLDVSDSMGPSLREAADRAEALSREAAARGEPAALVVFAGSAEVVRRPAAEPFTVPLEWIDPSRDERRPLARSRTDFAAALRVAESLGLPSARYLFVTDGRDPLATAPSRPDVRFLRIDRSAPDVAVTAVHAPPSVRTGEPFDLRVDFASVRDAEIDAVVMIDDAEIRREKVALPAGTSSVRLRNLQVGLSHGPHRIAVLVRSKDDVERRNNHAGAPLFALGKPRVLLIEESSAAGEPLAKMLLAHEFEVRRIPPSRLETELSGGCAAVVSVGVRAGSFPPKGIEMLRDYVGNGGGFWFVPPADPSASAEIARSPLASWLPVEFEPAAVPKGTGREPAKRNTAGDSGRKERVLSSTVALLLLVDKSGSMAGDKLELVKEACRVTADTLAPGDSIGVMAFSTKPEWVVEFTSPERKEYLRDQIYRLLADGGTDIHPALVEAHRAMLTNPRARSAGIKHVILFSDGDTRPGDIPGQVKRMAESGITISTVCILIQDFDLFLMKEIADLGRGRFRYTSSFQHVPKIFTEEARALLEEKRPRRTEEPPTDTDRRESKSDETAETGSTVVPRVLEAHEVLWDGMPAALPALRGILPTKRREGTIVPLASEEKRPILAVGRVGLGKAAVWTSDLEGKWSADWLRWPEASKLFAHLVRHLSSAAETPDLAERVTLRSDPAGVRIRIAPGPAGERLRLGRMRPSREEVTLEPDPDGGHRAFVPAEEDPTELALTREREGRVESLTLLVPRPCEAEYLPVPPMPCDAPETLRPGPSPERERRKPLAPWLLLAAALLLPLDVGLRRIR